MERTAYEYDVIKADRARLMTRKKLMEARARKVFILKCMVLSVVLVAFIGIYGILAVNASDTQNTPKKPVKYYTSITVNSGDTLWDIAKEYKPADCSMTSYINEVMLLNDMGTSMIYAGQNIIIYYMSDISE